MSTTQVDHIKPMTVRDIMARKSQDPLVCLTAYTAPMARMLDRHVDLLLVGDSLGMVVYGMETTVGVTLEMMSAHGKAVAKTARHAMVVVDMPFGSYQECPEQAFRNAARLMAETGCAGVKIEGGQELADTIAFLVQRGIPVMGHVGLKPQSVHTMGGFRAQGRNASEADMILTDAKAVEEAGAFSVVLEGTFEGVSRDVAAAVGIPVIGIGASAHCDGQILVSEDVLGLFGEFTPKFVKRYAELGDTIDEAVSRYASDVRARRFPAPEHCFGMKKAG